MPLVCVVDDDDAVRTSLALLLGAVGYEVETHDSAETFLAGGAGDAASVLILDLRMPGLSGLQLQAELEQRGAHAPIIFLSGHGDVPAAARALRGGAIDFMEKPFDTDVLLARVAEAVVTDTERRTRQSERSRVEGRLDQLTPREREVLDHVVRGAANKVIAAELGISERTVELHRGRGMKKMDVRSPAELTQAMLSVTS